MTSNTPRLADIPGIKHPNECQSCSASNLPGFGNGLMRLSTTRWQEHDHNDKPEPKVIVLCNKCSDQLIVPHERLYSSLMPNDPFPGCMAICVDCKHRVGVSCSHPDAKANGGTGVLLDVKKPFHAMVDGPKYRGPLTMWPEAPKGCKQRELCPTP